jgi:predicted DNA-binding transcriptional regulator YafY
MRAGRLVDMLLTLQRRGRLTAAELATALEVSPRTILRDVDALSSAGVPIYAVQGVGGGIELVDRFRTQLTAFTADEAAALFLAGQPVVAHHLGFGAAAAATRRKLLDALPDGLRDNAEAIDVWFLHDPLAQDGIAVPYGELRRLAKAVAQAVEVEVSFANDAPRPLQPLGIVLAAGSWHLAVLGDAGARFVRIDDLRGLRVTRRTFERPADFELAAAWRVSRTEGARQQRPPIV